jgi:hypothetical protein
MGKELSKEINVEVVEIVAEVTAKMGPGDNLAFT